MCYDFNKKTNEIILYLKYINVKIIKNYIYLIIDVKILTESIITMLKLY